MNFLIKIIIFSRLEDQKITLAYNNCVIQWIIEIFGLGLLIPISQIILNENFITNNQLLQNLVSYSNLHEDKSFNSIFFISYIIKILLRYT